MPEPSWRLEKDIFFSCPEGKPQQLLRVNLDLCQLDIWCKSAMICARWIMLWKKVRIWLPLNPPPLLGHDPPFSFPPTTLATVLLLPWLLCLGYWTTPCLGYWTALPNSLAYHMGQIFGHPPAGRLLWPVYCQHVPPVADLITCNWKNSIFFPAYPCLLKSLASCLVSIIGGVAGSLVLS